MLFLRFLKDRLRFFLLILFFIGILVLFFYLENLPRLPLLDILIWFVLASFFYSLFDFIQYRKKHIELLEIKKALHAQLLPFPNSSTLIEEDYHHIVNELNRQYLNFISQTDIKKSELDNYYTLWVHQIKIPLSVLQLILESERDIHAVSRMQEEIVRIEHYLEMLLNFLRLESLSADLLIQSYSLDTVIRESIKKNRDIFLRKKIIPDVQISATQVLTDQKWLSFILDQLISNALKYTSKGYIRIYMDPKRKNTLIIEDTGIGIPSEDLPRIWERGFTGYNGRIQKKASGLGLYMCKIIADRLSLSLSISSELGKGTRVALSFPDEKIEIE